MSWKSFVSAGLLCVLASPVFAAPTVSGTNGGANNANGWLNDDGDFVWTIQIAPTNPLPTGSTPLAAELGFTTSGTSTQLQSNATNANATLWDTSNPGADIFASAVDGDWETYGSSGFPEGIQTNTTTNEIFTAMGSDVITTTGPQDYINIVVERPSTTDSAVLATSTINLVGAYSGNGRIGELDDPGAAGACAFDSCNYDIYTNSVTVQAKAGDTDLSGAIAFNDYTTLLNNYFVDDGQRKWFTGDFNGNNDVDFQDYTMLLNNYFPPNNSYTVLVDGTFATAPTPGGGASVPEPASVALLALCGLGLVGLRFRRRG